MVSHYITKVAVVSHHVPEVAVVSHHVLAIDSAAFWGTRWGGPKGTKWGDSKGTLWGVLRVDLAMFWGCSGGVLGPHRGGARKRFVWHAAN